MRKHNGKQAPSRRVAMQLSALALVTSLQCAAEYAEDLTSLSLDELMEIDIGLSARLGDSVRESPAAVYILTRESISRSGANNIPELLRLVPGVEVTRFGKGKWGIGIRGFNGGIFTNRLLILVDGRSVFSPAKVGMFWDTLDTLISDIERIEVVRGPGTALWGSNAFNGVINIVTREAADTTGGIVEIGAGDEEKWFAGVRYGGEFGSDGHWRGYVKSFERDDASRPDGSENHDGWTGSQAGLRFDFGSVDRGAVSIQISAYEGEEGEELDLPDLSSPTLGGRFRTTLTYSGANLLADWRRQVSPRSHYSVRFSADHSEREDLLFDLTIDSYDLDFKHDYRPSAQHRLIWGLGYRYTTDNLQDQHIRFDPVRRHYDVGSGFFQYEHTLSDALRLVAGAKLEYNEFTGREWQPNIRAIWQLDEYSSVWAAVSRAHRTPSRTEHDAIIDFDYVNPAVQLQIRGDDGFESERLQAHELGWRRQFTSSLNVDLALFYNEYDGLRTLEPGAVEPTPNPPPMFTVPVIASNGADARSWGGELLVTNIFSPSWRGEFQYSQVQIAVNPRNSGDPNVENAEGESPLHRANLRSHWDLPGELGVSAMLRYVDRVERQNIDEYTELDLVIDKQINPHLKLSLTGRNLLDKAHEEYVDRVVGTPRAEVERGVNLRMSFEF